MAPALKDHAAIKRLSFRRYHQAIVLAPCVAVRVTPVQFKGFKFQLVQRKEQILAPLVAIAALLEAVIHEKIVKDRRTKGPVFFP